MNPNEMESFLFKYRPFFVFLLSTQAIAMNVDVWNLFAADKEVQCVWKGYAVGTSASLTF